MIVDLKGFTSTGAAGDSIGVGIGVFAGTNGPNSYPITVRNGSLINFGFGVWAEAGNFALMTDITVNNLVIHLGPAGQSGNGGWGVIFRGGLFDGKQLQLQWRELWHRRHRKSRRKQLRQRHFRRRKPTLCDHPEWRNPSSDKPLSVRRATSKQVVKF